MTRMIGLLVLAAAVAAAAQEHTYTPAEIEAGARLYQSSCAGCHGPNGDMVPGIDLLRGQFRRGTSDAEINRIIRQGISGTTMPPSSFTEAQAGTIVAFLRASATTGGAGAPGGRGGRGGGAAAGVATGNAANGKTLFESKGACGTCHRVGSTGPRVAPDLTEVGIFRPPTELRQKLVDPSANVRVGNRYVELTPKRGAKITGRLLNQDTYTVQIIDTNERLLSIARADLQQDMTFLKESPMPSYRDKLSAAELEDLVAYLVSLKGLRP